MPVTDTLGGVLVIETERKIPVRPASKTRCLSGVRGA
jgi:hypothetical protein